MVRSNEACSPKARIKRKTRKASASEFLLSNRRHHEIGLSPSALWSPRILPGSSHGRRQTMKTPIALALLAILAFATSPAAAVERACRPSLSNAYHCPDTSASQPRRRNESTDRPCRPSFSNGYSCPGTSSEGRGYAPSNRTASTPERGCRPSLSNGFSCSGTEGRESTNRTAPTQERGCRPSLSNGYNCPREGQTGVNQYSTETLARVHCPIDTVVWANTRSGIYHFRGDDNYGTTKRGAYMCERDALAGGIRMAKNEKHP